LAAAQTASELIVAAFQECLASGKSLSEISSDDLLAAFMKLNIADKLKDPEVMQDLQDLMKECRKMSNTREIAANQEAADKYKAAMKKAEEASGYAKIMKPILTVIIVVVIVAAIVATVFTAGASSVVGATVVLGVTVGAATTAIAVTAAIIAAVAIVCGAVINREQASLNHDAAIAFTEADKKTIDAKMMERLKEFFQGNIEDNQKLMQAIMESVNQFYQAVIKMVTAKGETGKLLLSATSYSG
jgi:hypothetical protein